MDVPYDVRRVDHRVAASQDYAKVEQRTGWKKKSLKPDDYGETRIKRGKRRGASEIRLANGNAWQSPIC